MVAGRSYNLSDCDTAFVPEGQPHRFINHSDDVMGMIWVYAGDEPERTVVEVGYCDGTLAWADPPIALLRN
jgi:oxalate decarboxylase/phosphoglucose isomerase-like protein (cupin superfamily)